MKQYLSVFFFAVFFVLGSSAVSAKEETPESLKGTTKVTAEQVVDLVMNKSDLVILDARKASDRESAGWIEGSIERGIQ